MKKPVDFVFAPQIVAIDGAHVADVVPGTQQPVSFAQGAPQQNDASLDDFTVDGIGGFPQRLDKYVQNGRVLGKMLSQIRNLPFLVATVIVKAGIEMVVQPLPEQRRQGAVKMGAELFAFPPEIGTQKQFRGLGKFRGRPPAAVLEVHFREQLPGGPRLKPLFERRRIRRKRFFELSPVTGGRFVNLRPLHQPQPLDAPQDLEQSGTFGDLALLGQVRAGEDRFFLRRHEDEQRPAGVAKHDLRHGAGGQREMRHVVAVGQHGNEVVVEHSDDLWFLEIGLHHVAPAAAVVDQTQAERTVKRRGAPKSFRVPLPPADGAFSHSSCKRIDASPIHFISSHSSGNSLRFSMTCEAPLSFSAVAS